MKTKLNRSLTDPQATQGYIEHTGGKGTPKCSISDPSHKARSWVIGAGQRTPIIRVPKGHRLLAWVASKGYLRFVEVHTMGAGGGSAQPTPIAPLRQIKDGKGVITSMGDRMPSGTPKSKVQGSKTPIPEVELDTEIGRHKAPEQTPLQLMERDRRLQPAEASEATVADIPPMPPDPEPVVEPEPVIEPELAVEPEAPAEELSLEEQLGELEYKQLKELADRYEITYQSRSAKAITNAILLYAEEHPEVAIVV